MKNVSAKQLFICAIRGIFIQRISKSAKSAIKISLGPVLIGLARARRLIHHTEDAFIYSTVLELFMHSDRRINL